MKKGNLLFPILITTLVLILATLGNIYVISFNWSILDFLIMGVMVFGGTLIIDIFIKRIKENKYRLIFSLLILLLFIYIWAELAVGLFFNLGS